VFNYIVYLRINLKAHAGCDLNFIVKGEGLLKVTGSHVHWKVVNGNHIRILHNRSNCNDLDLDCSWRSFRYCKLFQVRYFV